MWMLGKHSLCVVKHRQTTPIVSHHCLTYAQSGDEYFHSNQEMGKSNAVTFQLYWKSTIADRSLQRTLAKIFVSENREGVYVCQATIVTTKMYNMLENMQNLHCTENPVLQLLRFCTIILCLITFVMKKYTTVTDLESFISFIKVLLKL